MDKWKNNERFPSDEDDIEEIIDGDSDEESEESEQRLIRKLDDELLEYFSEARIISKKPSGKHKKKEKIIYLAGQEVTVQGRKGTIIYGPYDQDGKQMYEIELENNGVICTEDKHIKRD